MHSQDIKKEVERLKTLGKDSLVNLAWNKFNQNKSTKYIINKSEFDYTRVLASDKRVIISFERNVFYVPLYSQFYYNLKVEFPSGKITKENIESNNHGKDGHYHPKSNSDLFTDAYLYILDNDASENISLVLRAIGLDHLDKTNNWSSKITIKEREHSFWVESMAGSYETGGGKSIYEVEKETGEMVVAPLTGVHIMASPTPPPNDNEIKETEEFIEIKS
ncbi:hypothetical protein [Aquimarina sp. MMG016]|uniref:hypothetical protein n=1 Tax=Aquimarina sp. MMG016 TaxID=2822690 RepID=UPI001B39CE15|nr:hypothetical protein [Aquimarina sp. MMG016]MBQ4822177.1 hypothetical protein [Aquimarina sp. MMG016]